MRSLNQCNMLNLINKSNEKSTFMFDASMCTLVALEQYFDSSKTRRVKSPLVTETVSDSGVSRCPLLLFHLTLAATVVAPIPTKDDNHALKPAVPFSADLLTSSVRCPCPENGLTFSGSLTLKAQSFPKLCLIQA